MGRSLDVTVVVPVFNRARSVDRAIGSIFGQDLESFEIVVVDDGSTDGLEASLTKWGSDRLHYVRHDRNLGASAARNTGIRAARGRYVAFLDSDDEWLPGKLARQLDRMERDGGPCISGNRISSDSRRPGHADPRTRGEFDRLGLLGLRLWVRSRNHLGRATGVLRRRRTIRHGITPFGRLGLVVAGHLVVSNRHCQATSRQRLSERSACARSRFSRASTDSLESIRRTSARTTGGRVGNSTPHLPSSARRRATATAVGWTRSDSSLNLSGITRFASGAT